ncbi:MAG: SDR family oxidoreductase [Alphaproteobacteria bacterium]|nr:SDR family oxidoreductase [Alphaproteobacteria bacterium]
MRILITGGAGFVGSHLSERLLAEGNEVVVVDSLVTGSERNLASFVDHEDFTFIEADASEELPIDGAFDRIYHLASPASPIDYVEKPFVTLYAGSDATRLCLERALEDGARFLVASTSEVYGDPAVHPQVESYWGNVNPIGPRSVYDEAKRYGEALTMAFHRYKGVETHIARIFNTYGPRMRTDDGRVIPAFGSQALRGEPLTVFGDGLQTRSFCYVSDLVDGLIRLMESDLREPCNLGNPVERTMLELAEIVNARTGNAAGIVHRPLPKDDPTRRRPDITRARTELGWEPKVEFADGLARTIDYFAEVLGIERS